MTVEKHAWEPVTEYDGHTISQRIRFVLDDPQKAPPDIEELERFDTFRCHRCGEEAHSLEAFGSAASCSRNRRVTA